MERVSSTPATFTSLKKKELCGGKMSDIVFKDCEYRYVEDGTLCCKI